MPRPGFPFSVSLSLSLFLSPLVSLSLFIYFFWKYLLFPSRCCCSCSCCWWSITLLQSTNANLFRQSFLLQSSVLFFFSFYFFINSIFFFRLRFWFHFFFLHFLKIFHWYPIRFNLIQSDSRTGNQFINTRWNENAQLIDSRTLEYRSSRVFALECWYDSIGLIENEYYEIKVARRRGFAR